MYVINWTDWCWKLPLLILFRLICLQEPCLSNMLWDFLVILVFIFQFWFYWPLLDFFAFLVDLQVLNLILHISIQILGNPFFILGVLMHTFTWDQLWGCDESLTWVLVIRFDAFNSKVFIAFSLFLLSFDFTRIKFLKSIGLFVLICIPWSVVKFNINTLGVIIFGPPCNVQLSLVPRKMQ